MARVRTLSPAALFDIAVVVFVTAVTEWAVFDTQEHISTHIAGPRWVTVPLPLLIALPLLWRRSQPLLVAALVMVGFATQAFASGHTPEGLQLILVWVIVAYSVAAYSARRDALIGFAVVLAGFGVYAAENDDIVSGRGGDLWAGAFFLILAVGAWLAGMVVHGRGRRVSCSGECARARGADRERRGAVAHGTRAARHRLAQPERGRRPGGRRPGACRSA